MADFIYAYIGSYGYDLYEPEFYTDYEQAKQQLINDFVKQMNDEDRSIEIADFDFTKDSVEYEGEWSFGNDAFWINNCGNEKTMYQQKICKIPTQVFTDIFDNINRYDIPASLVGLSNTT